jgi:phenylpyruvate tautomerase PptA (4-oxalocrotonate tautomerase family)
MTAPATNTASDEIVDKQRIIAAVSAVIAEELGTDVSALRIKSFKKL